MFYEFALDPSLVATWHDRKKFFFFDEKFNLRQRRIISIYPKRWTKEVWEAFYEGPDAENQNAQIKLEALLNDLLQLFVKRKNTFVEIQNWIEKTEKEHLERPFRAIISNQNLKDRNYVISADKLAEDGHHLWIIPKQLPVQRYSEEFSKAVSPLLRISNKIVFIDPYLNPSKERFIKPLTAFFHDIWINRYGGDNPHVELHTGIDRFFHEYGPERDIEEENKTCNHLIYEFKKNLPKIIPSGKEVKITIWKQRLKGEKLHNRYILTENCGIAFGVGLDQSGEEDSAETDDLHWLEEGVLDFRNREYLGNPPAFDKVIPSFKIIGSLS